MSLDLAKTPPLADAPPVTDAAAPTGIPTQSVIVSEPPAWATSRVEQPPVVARSEPAAEPAQPANEPERRAVPKPAAKPAAAVEAPVVAKTTAVSPVPAGIDKRMRDQTPRQRAEVEYTRGASALQQGRLAEARSGFEAALQTDPAYHAARQALAGVLLDAGQPAEAMLILQEGLQLAPTQFGFAMMAARLHVDRGEIDAAVQTLARSADYAGNSADYAGFYAGLLQRQKKHAEAVGMFDRALRLRPNSGVWLLGMGISLEALGRGAEAQESFRRARATGNLTPELQTFADQRLR
jgi:MSHA biogenesis protein MshN